MSTSAYVARYLKHLPERDGPNSFNYLLVDRRVVIGLLELVSEKEVLSFAATQGVALLRETVQSLYGDSTLQNVWRVMAFIAQQTHSRSTNFESNDERAVLVHAVSKRWSMYLGESITKLLEQIGYSAAYEAHENSLIVTVKSSRKPQAREA